MQVLTGRLRAEEPRWGFLCAAADPWRLPLKKQVPAPRQGSRLFFWQSQRFRIKVLLKAATGRHERCLLPRRGIWGAYPRRRIRPVLPGTGCVRRGKRSGLRRIGPARPGQMKGLRGGRRIQPLRPGQVTGPRGGRKIRPARPGQAGCLFFRRVRSGGPF